MPLLLFTCRLRAMICRHTLAADAVADAADAATSLIAAVDFSPPYAYFAAADFFFFCFFRHDAYFRAADATAATYADYAHAIFRFLLILFYRHWPYGYDAAYYAADAAAVYAMMPPCRCLPLIFARLPVLPDVTFMLVMLRAIFVAYRC